MLFLYACVDACVDTNLCWSACLLACVHASLLACLLACLLASLHGFMHKSCVQARSLGRLAHSRRAHCVASQVGYASSLSLIQSYHSSESSPHRSDTRCVPPIMHESHRSSESSTNPCSHASRRRRRRSASAIICPQARVVPDSSSSSRAEVTVREHESRAVTSRAVTRLHVRLWRREAVAA